MSVLVVLQGVNGELSRISTEALTAGLQLAESQDLPLEAAVLGSDVSQLASQVGSPEVEKVYLLEHPLLDEYTSEGYTLALEQLIQSCSPSIVLFPHTYQVRDYAPKLAARFGSTLISDVVEIKSQGLPVYFVRQLFLGKLHADVCTDAWPAFVSVQAGAFRSLDVAPAGASAASATMEAVTLELYPAQIASKPEPPFREARSSVDLSGAGTIVAVGRGIQGKEDLAMVEILAQELGAELAASRPICDSGLVPMDRLVGSSGQSVAPNIYFAVGISGAIQHRLGMNSAKVVVAINKDSSAPIFDSAHYGIVGDLKSVVPALVDELRKMKS